MENLNFEIIHYFMNENVILAEIKKKDNSPPSSWIKINTSSQIVESLPLKSSTKEIVNGNEITIRIFSEAELRFDASFAKFQHKGSGQILMNCSTKDVPNIIMEKIDSFLSSIARH